MIKQASKIRSPILESAIQPLVDGTAPSIFSLSGKGIDAFEMYSIGSDIATNSGITSLDLSDNPLRDEGAILLAAMLVSQSSFQSIYLRSISVTDLGVEAISGALLSNSVLTSLDLSSNRMIGLHGIDMLAKSVELNQTVCRVSLGESYADGVYVIPNSAGFEKNTYDHGVRNQHNCSREIFLTFDGPDPRVDCGFSRSGAADRCNPRWPRPYPDRRLH